MTITTIIHYIISYDYGRYTHRQYENSHIFHIICGILERHFKLFIIRTHYYRLRLLFVIVVLLKLYISIGLQLVAGTSSGFLCMYFRDESAKATLQNAENSFKHDLYVHVSWYYKCRFMV